MKSDVCRTCGAAITWIETGNGKRTPLDLPARRRWVQTPAGWQLLETYESHFSTCPNAKEWKGKSRENKTTTPNP